MLTRKQKELFDYLTDYIAKNSISPSFEEMKTAINLKSKSGIHRLVTSLEQRGFIKRLKHKARAMEITKNLNNNVVNFSKNYENNAITIPLLGSIAEMLNLLFIILIGKIPIPDPTSKISIFSFLKKSLIIFLILFTLW